MTNDRRALRVDVSGEVAVLTESTFATERALHETIASHPAVLPHADFGLGPLATIASELQLDAGAMDLLLADPQGRLAICEFKKGRENPDVRRVVAQLLDYGSSLWGLDYDTLDRLVGRAPPAIGRAIAERAAEQFPEDSVPGFDYETFRSGVETSLQVGNFVFLYVVRDLDDRTRRIMTYLAEGPRMAFFGVEVDHFRATDGASLLIPRTAFVPSWVNERRPRSVTDPDAEKLAGLMDELANDLGTPVAPAETGKRYLNSAGAYIGVYRTRRGMEFGLKGLRDVGLGDLANELGRRLTAIWGKPLQGRDYPSFPCQRVLEQWGQIRADIVIPFLSASLVEPTTSAPAE